MAFPALFRAPFFKGVAVVIWAAAVVSGFAVLTEYQNAPGAPADAPAAWPSESRLAPAPDRPTLLVFAHPRCPCTQATMGELARLMRHVGERVRVYTVFLQPEAFADDWTEEALWRRAGAMDGVRRWRDRDGRETERFGAATSGQVLLYDAGGTLRFRGGLTGSRGHEGANDGRAALRALLERRPAAHEETFVFGCPLHEPGQGRAACTDGTCPR